MKVNAAMLMINSLATTSVPPASAPDMDVDLDSLVQGISALSPARFAIPPFARLVAHP